MEGHLKCRSAGGHLVHMVENDTRTALCGHKPSNPKSRLMKNRAKWRKLHDQDREVTCEKCKKKMGTVQ